MAEVRCVWPGGAVLGEGPIWDEEADALYWVDIKGLMVHRLFPDTGDVESWPVPDRIGCIAQRKGGGFVAGFKSGVSFLDLDSGRIERIANPDANEIDNRINDGKCDRNGRFWFGTMDDAEAEPTGALYRLDPDLGLQRMDAGYVVTNGPAFSPDGRTLYHNDTFQRIVYAFDLTPDGGLEKKRVLIRLEEGQGYPDGQTVDEEGYLWLAHWGGGRVTRFAPDGQVDRVLELPVAQVTSCVFGGPGLETLYITTASIGLDNAARFEQPLAGGLFAAEVGVRGLPTNRFAG